MILPEPILPFCKNSFGDLDFYSLSDGAIDRPLREGVVANASLDDLRQVLRGGGYSDTVLRSHFTAAAVVRNGDIVLIDTGAGGFPVYGTNSGNLQSNMVTAGLDPHKVKTIIFTHLHGDHIYGLFDKDTLLPRFPNADIIFPAADLSWWLRPGVESLDLGPTREGLALRIRATIAVWKNVRTFEGDKEILPGIFSIAAYGHSPGHTAYLVKTASRDLLVSADVCVNPTLVLKRLHWRLAIDQDPELAAATRRRVFDQVATEKLLITGTHWRLPSVGTLVKVADGYDFEPLS